jgi:ADP-heptose:LPS heptosyltransferase
LRQVRARPYDIAIDLQGRWKSVLFLYAAKARRRYVKGRWPLLPGFRDRQLHALVEMDKLLEYAGIAAGDTHMEVFPCAEDHTDVESMLRGHGWPGGEYLVISPFTRWPSKNWGSGRYGELLELLPDEMPVVISGAAADRREAEQLVNRVSTRRVINLCGELELGQFAALVGDASAMVSGDSFAMHLAVACGTPVVALFGPTAESRVGPRSERCVLLRAGNGCDVCYRRECPRRCIDGIEARDVLQALESLEVLDVSASTTSRG